MLIFHLSEYIKYQYRIPLQSHNFRNYLKLEGQKDNLADFTLLSKLQNIYETSHCSFHKTLTICINFSPLSNSLKK